MTKNGRAAVSAQNTANPTTAQTDLSLFIYCDYTLSTDLPFLGNFPLSGFSRSDMRQSFVHLSMVYWRHTFLHKCWGCRKRS